jgi:hypothetical protein
MEIAGVLVVQRENRDRGAFEIGGVDYWVTQAGVPSRQTPAKMATNCDMLRLEKCNNEYLGPGLQAVFLRDTVPLIRFS